MKSNCEQLRQMTKDHSLWKHPFIHRCRREPLPLPALRMFATQMYLFSREFSRFLAATLAACDTESARLVIAANLWEEMGEGRAELAHPALFRRFTRALKIDDAILESSPAHPATRRLVQTYMKLPSRYGYLGALGGLCFGSEGLVSTLYQQLLGAVDEALVPDEEALAFFHVHIECDDGHAEALEQILVAEADQQNQWMAVERAVRACLDARVDFFSGCEEQIASKAADSRFGDELLGTPDSSRCGALGM